MVRYIAAICLFVLAVPCLADELTTTEGSKFNGTFVKLEAGNVHFNDKAAGEVKIPVAKVASLSLDGEKKVKIRRGADINHQEDVTLASKDGELSVQAGDGVSEAVKLTVLRGINETVPDRDPLWTGSLLFNFGWTDGNTKTYSMGFRGDLKRETEFNFQGIYAEGNYLQDRTLEEDPVRRRDYAAGYFYRYIFKFRLTVDVTEDITWNELAGYHWRSITGVGPGYYILREDNQWLHAGLHLTYTYEDQMFGAEDRNYWGMRARAEYDLVSASKASHLNARSEFLFDFEESKNIVMNNTLLAETRPTAWLSAGLLIRHTWDNMPVPGFKQHDFSLLFTLGITWSGRWV